MRGKSQLTSKLSNPENDLTIPLKDKPEFLEPWSEAWAKIVEPFAYIVLGTVILVISIPAIATLFVEDIEKIKLITDWSKTALAPVTGFVGAVIGYYFAIKNI